MRLSYYQGHPFGTLAEYQDFVGEFAEPSPLNPLPRVGRKKRSVHEIAIWVDGSSGRGDAILLDWGPGSSRLEVKPFQGGAAATALPVKRMDAAGAVEENGLREQEINAIGATPSG